ncbi:MAG: head-tail connector protein, partial [Treponema sp.]|nr:head-tail connector protein [Treponema sp.]
MRTGRRCVKQEKESGQPRISRKDLERLANIHKQLKEGRAAMDAKWRDIARYINPDMDWNGEPDATEKPQESAHVYDTTAIKASNTLADGIQGYSFARNQAWFKLEPEDTPDTGGEESGWLAAAEKEMYRQSQKSNFYDEGRAFVKCAADFGTAIMTRTDDVIRRIPAYKTQHLKHCCIDENPYGEADVLFRDFWADAFKAAAIFGEERLPKPIKEAYGKGRLKPWKFTQAIFPPDRYGLGIPKRDGQEYYSVFWADIERDRPLMDGYFQLKPFFVWRWSQNLDGGVWGSGSPGTAELADIKQANSVRADYSRIVQQMGRPPIKATEGLNGRINLKPNGVTSLRQGEDFTAVPVTGNPQGIMQDLALLQRSINEAYYTDFFLILSQNIEKQKTATEVAGIQGEKAALMSAFYGRLSA